MEWVAYRFSFVTVYIHPSLQRTPKGISVSAFSSGKMCSFTLIYRPSSGNVYVCADYTIDTFLSVERTIELSCLLLSNGVLKCPMQMSDTVSTMDIAWFGLLVCDMLTA